MESVARLATAFYACVSPRLNFIASASSGLVASRPVLTPKPLCVDGSSREPWRSGTEKSRRHLLGIGMISSSEIVMSMPLASNAAFTWNVHSLVLRQDVFHLVRDE